MTYSKNQEDMLERYWLALAQDAEAQPPEQLDPEIADTTRRMVAALRPPEPAPGFRDALARRLAAQAARQANKRRRGPFFRFPWFAPPTPMRFAAAFALLVVVVAGAFALREPQSVSAETIMQRANSFAESFQAQGMRSLVVTRVSRTWDEGFRQVQQRLWYEAPNKWRMETETLDVGANGTTTDYPAQLAVTDGATYWMYDQATNSATQSRVLPPGAYQRIEPPPLLDEINLGFMLRDNDCYPAMLAGREVVAGRAAYVVEVRAACEGDENTANRWRYWVDQETYLLLKEANYVGANEQPLREIEMTSVEYNAPIDPERFRFTPPDGATVEDRSMPLPPGAEEFRAAVDSYASRAEFPVLLPNALPRNLVPRWPNRESTSFFSVEYLPPDQVDTTASAPVVGVRVEEQPASGENLPAPLDGEEAVQIGGLQAIYAPGLARGNGLFYQRRLTFVVGETAVTLDSETLTKEELVRLAASFAPVGAPQR